MEQSAACMWIQCLWAREAQYWVCSLKALRFQLWRLAAAATVHEVFINSGHTPRQVKQTHWPRHTGCSPNLYHHSDFMSRYLTIFSPLTFRPKRNGPGLSLETGHTSSESFFSPCCFSIERKLDVLCTSMIRLDSGLLTGKLPHRGQRVSWLTRLKSVCSLLVTKQLK